MDPLLLLFYIQFCWQIAQLTRNRMLENRKNMCDRLVTSGNTQCYCRRELGILKQHRGILGYILIRNFLRKKMCIRDRLRTITICRLWPWKSRFKKEIRKYKIWSRRYKKLRKITICWRINIVKCWKMYK